MTDPTARPEHPRVVLLGGSTAFGLGVRGLSYGVLAAQRLDASATLDLTSSGPLIDEDLANFETVSEFGPDIAILGVGIAEQMVHPHPVVQRTIERVAPPSWHGVAGLQPRPYFSTTSRVKRVRQRVVSRTKTTIKRATLRFGGHQRMPLAEFGRQCAELLGRLDSLGAVTLVVGTWPVDESLFPGTPAAMSDLADTLAEVVEPVASAHLVTPRVQVWDDYLADHIHWNESGHGRVADQIVDELRQAVT